MALFMETQMEEEQKQNQHLFATAVTRNDVILVQTLLESVHIDVNGLMHNGRTPLVDAATSQHSDLVKLLINHNADPRQACPSYTVSGWSGTENEKKQVKQIFPLEQALYSQPNEDIIHTLLTSGAEPRDFGWSYLDVVKTLIAKVNHPEGLMDFLLPKLEKETSSSSAFKNLLSGLLVTAVNNHRVKVVQILLNKGANANHRHTAQNLPVLVLAANQNDLALCKVLVNAGAVLNQLSYIEDVLPLTCAVDSGLTKAVDILIQLGAEVNVHPHHHVNKTTLVHVAVDKRFFSILSLLLKAGATIRAVGKEGNSPLHIASREDSDLHDYLSLLLSRIQPGDSIVDHKNTRGQTALLVAVQNKNIECARSLIKAGAEVNTIDGNGESVLLQAVRVCSDQLVSMLLGAGANTSQGRSMGCTPLLTAVWQGDFTVTEMLLEWGADPRAVRESSQESALHLAVAAQSEDILRLLLDTGKMDINARTDSGDTPLMLAARGSCTEACRVLVDYNANLNLTDYNQEETALSLAVYFGKETNACMLIKEGADVDIADHS